jgi:hypothetical protein
MIDDYSNPSPEEPTPVVGATEATITPFLDPPPTYEDRLTETGLTRDATMFLGNKVATWVQPDLGDDAGYWETSDLELAPVPDSTTSSVDEILERLAVIEAALGINS